MKFHGKNFQAWEEFDLDISGLTVLTGPSDKGKSAIFRALRGLFYNKLNEAFIREGSEAMELIASGVEGDFIVLGPPISTGSNVIGSSGIGIGAAIGQIVQSISYTRELSRATKFTLEEAEQNQIKLLSEKKINTKIVANGHELSLISLHTVAATRAKGESTKYEVEVLESVHISANISTQKIGTPRTVKFAKLAGKRPEELKALGVNDIHIGDTDLDPIFAPQNDTQFLIQGVGPAELNNILGGFASTEKLEYGKREANLRVTQKNAEARTLAVEIHEAQVRQDRFERQFAAAEPIFTRMGHLEYTVSERELQIHLTGEVLKHKFAWRELRTLVRDAKVPEKLAEEVTTLLSKTQATHTALYAADALQHYTYHKLKVDEAVNQWREVKRIYLNILAVKSIQVGGVLQTLAVNAHLSEGIIKESESKVAAAEVRIKAVRDCMSHSATLDTTKIEEASLTAQITAFQEEERVLRATAAEFADKLITCPACGERFTG